MTRTSYHHGDLRAALVQAAVEAARTGGADGVRLTRLAQQLGVSAAAAYRHFPDGLDGLLAAVGDVGRSELAAAIRTATDDVVAGDPVERATRRFRASGQAYVAHVTGSPGLFQVACRYEGGGAADPFRLLEACLDDLVDVGVLPAERRPLAPVAAWAAVHGLSVLLTEGPLRRLPPPEQQRAVDRTLDMVAAGL